MDDPQCAIEARSRRVPDEPDNYESCYCPMCPTYNQCMIDKKERLYCSRGPSTCEVKRLSCVCGECSVAIRYALSSNYYCDQGPAKF